jgi:hypothetical protein
LIEADGKATYGYNGGIKKEAYMAAYNINLHTIQSVAVDR